MATKHAETVLGAWCEEHGTDAAICNPCRLAARRESNCPGGCNSQIKPGDPICRLASGFYGCEDCWTWERRSDG